MTKIKNFRQQIVHCMLYKYFQNVIILKYGNLVFRGYFVYDHKLSPFPPFPPFKPRYFFVVAAASEPEASEQGSNPNLYMWVKILILPLARCIMVPVGFYHNAARSVALKRSCVVGSGGARGGQGGGGKCPPKIIFCPPHFAPPPQFLIISVETISR